VEVPETVAVAGSGAIACGLASVVAVKLGKADLIARSEESAERARKQCTKLIEKMEGDPGALTVSSDHNALHQHTYVIEAITEEHDHKAELLAKLHEDVDEGGILASTTSSLNVQKLGDASGRPDMFAALHVFNPVPRMALVELAFPKEATEEVKQRTRDLCEALGKTPVEVADSPGFVVNRLLFPFLFDAVRVMEDQGLEPKAVDTCMKLGAGHPMGPLALLDFVGIDVSIAIGEQVGVDIPAKARELLEAGHLGRKSGKGFYEYS
jgi:3-hydroxybutyryl-CoA dehydrogenase